MRSLTVLDVSKNKLTKLPESISTLQLKSIDVSHNHLSSLDDHIWKISTLEFLVASGNR